MHPGRCPHRARPTTSLVAAAVAAVALGACSNSTAGHPSVASTATSAPASTSAASEPASTPPDTAGGPSVSDTASAPPGSGTGSAPTSAPAPSTESSPAPLRQATVVVTYSGYDAASSTASAAAFVPGVLVPTAACTLVLVHAGVTHRVAKQAVPTANSMQCGTITQRGLAPGTWTGTVEFDSTTARGTSAPFTIQVTA